MDKRGTWIQENLVALIILLIFIAIVFALLIYRIAPGVLTLQ